MEDHGKTDRKASELLHLRQLSKGDPVSAPMVHASMYHLPGAPDAAWTYGRTDNPTWHEVEAALAHLEGAPVVLFPSGMAAISAAMFASLKAGARMLMPSDGYYSPRVLAENFLERFGIKVETRPTAAFAEGGFAGFELVFIETPSNPGLDLIDIAAVTQAVRDAGGRSVVDNTTMTALGQHPLELGADIVVASDTKAPGGHSDLLMGHVASRDPEILARIRDWRTYSGAIPGPMEAWLLLRGLESFEVRYDRMCRSAEIIAGRLAEHASVESLRFPGLPSDPSHNLARHQMSRFGFLIHLTLSDADTAEAFIERCPYILPATSFGGVHTSAERRLRWGDDVAPGAVRLSVGCEPVEALWSAIDAALTGAD